MQEAKSFWRPILLLLCLRLQVACDTLKRYPTTQVGVGISLLVIGPAATALGQAILHQFQQLPEAMLGIGLRAILLLVQVSWLLGLCLRGFACLGQNTPTTVLRPFGLRAEQIFLAELLGPLLDIPAFFALLVFAPLVFVLLSQVSWGVGLLVLSVFLLFCLHTVVSALLVEYGFRYLTTVLNRKYVLSLLVGVVCLVGYYGHASAATTPLAPTNLTLEKALPLSMPRLPEPAFAAYLPHGLVAQAMREVRTNQTASLAWADLGLLAYVGVTGYAALLLLRKNLTSTVSNPTYRPSKNPLPFSSSGGSNPHLSPFSQIVAVAIWEGRQLLRAPSQHLPLRNPACLVVYGILAWLLPNMGNRERYAFYNLHELLILGLLLVLVLWQVQLLCNRFGNEAGKASLLFSFSVNRLALLLGRNLALFGLLLGVDVTILNLLRVGMGLKLSFLNTLVWMPPILLVLTAVGNLLSVYYPFPIAQQGEKFLHEPERSLAAYYVGMGILVPLLLQPFRMALGSGVLPLLCGIAYLLGMYLLSLFLTTALLKRREQELINTLDGRKRR